MKSDAKIPTVPLVHICLNTYRQSTVVKAVQRIYGQESSGLNVFCHPCLLVRAVEQCITSFMGGSSVYGAREEWKELFAEKGMTTEVPGMSWQWRRCCSTQGRRQRFLKRLYNWEPLWLPPKMFLSQFWNDFNKSFICVLCFGFDL